jgi:hypothetical protein
MTADVHVLHVDRMSMRRAEAAMKCIEAATGRRKATTIPSGVTPNSFVATMISSGATPNSF